MVAKTKPHSSGPHRGCVVCKTKQAKAAKRGLCTACYQAAYRAIASGKSSWAELEAAGLALPLGAMKRKSKFLSVASQKLGKLAG